MTSVISCLGVLLVLIYLTVLHYFKRHSALTQLKWDVMTVTPGDYTVQLEITEEMWKNFTDRAIPEFENNGKPKIINFKHYLKH
jgi:hypothetical protein